MKVIKSTKRLKNPAREDFAVLTQVNKNETFTELRFKTRDKYVKIQESSISGADDHFTTLFFSVADHNLEVGQKQECVEFLIPEECIGKPPEIHITSLKHEYRIYLFETPEPPEIQFELEIKL